MAPAARQVQNKVDGCSENREESGIMLQYRMSESTSRGSTRPPLRRHRKELHLPASRRLLPPGLLVLVHPQPAVREAEFLQRPGHLGAVRRRGRQHHRHAVLVQRQHRRGALAQVQQQGHAGEGDTPPRLRRRGPPPCGLGKKDARNNSAILHHHRENIRENPI